MTVESGGWFSDTVNVKPLIPLFPSFFETSEILSSHCSKRPPPGLSTRTSGSSSAELRLSKQSRTGCGVVVVVEVVDVVEPVVVVVQY